jgi:NAD(P)-dependent dehydrogenase (short-subunit alcohol dehydrogenase family)
MSEKKKWALVLGVSSGFGEAAAKALAGAGDSIFGVHLDRRATLPHVAEVVASIRARGVDSVFWNANAADAEKRGEIVAEIADRTEGGRTGTVRVLLHSLAFGTLKPYVGSSDDSIAQPQIEMTLDVMANSLVYWTQDLVRAGLMEEGGRIYAMTSAGGRKVLPSYGAVSAAKSALESHVRQLACELISRGITVNALQAGITDTPALRKIPGSAEMIDRALAIHPARRLTTPEDVAATLVELARPGSAWMTGNVIRIDGGEDLFG